jgi:hypothetical protein
MGNHMVLPQVITIFYQHALNFHAIGIFVSFTFDMKNNLPN